MNADETDLSKPEQAALQRALQRWDADRETIPSSARLAQLRLRLQNEPSGDALPRREEAVSAWPTIAVAALVALMLGLALVWGRKPATPVAKGANPDHSRTTVAEEDRDVPPKPAEKADIADPTSPTATADVFETTVPLSPRAALHVENTCGTISIKEIDGNQLTIHAIKSVLGNAGSVNSIIIINGKRLLEPAAAGADKDALKNVTVRVSTQANGDVSVRTESKDSTLLFNVDYEIGIPRNGNLGNVRTSTGDINVVGSAGTPVLESTTGTIRMDGLRGVVTASCSNGSIEIARTQGTGKLSSVTGAIRVSDVGDVESAEASNGGIQIRGAKHVGPLSTVTGAIRVQNAASLASASASNGGIQLSDVAQTGRLESITGKIRLENCGGLIEASASNGSIDISGPSGIKKLVSVTGSITADISVLADDTKIEASNGSIRLRLSPTLNAKVHAESNNGSAKCSVPGLIQAKKREYDIGEKIDGTLGDGSHQLRIESVTGNISISPLP